MTYEISSNLTDSRCEHVYIATQSFSGCAETLGEPDWRTGTTILSKIKP